MREDLKPETTEDNAIFVPNDKENVVRVMLKKNNRAWSGKLDEINVTEMGIDLVPNYKPLNSPPLRARPKTRERERAETNKQLKPGIFEPVMSKWAAPMLFVPKKMDS